MKQLLLVRNEFFLSAHVWTQRFRNIDCSIGLEIVTLLFGNNSGMQSVIAVVALAGSLISIVAYFFYLGLLKRTVAMLEQ